VLQPVLQPVAPFARVLPDPVLYNLNLSYSVIILGVKRSKPTDDNDVWFTLGSEKTGNAFLRHGKHVLYFFATNSKLCLGLHYLCSVRTNNA
jgi:hypothetical protein